MIFNFLIIFVRSFSGAAAQFAQQKQFPFAGGAAAPTLTTPAAPTTGAEGAAAFTVPAAATVPTTVPMAANYKKSVAINALRLFNYHTNTSE